MTAIGCRRLDGSVVLAGKGGGMLGLGGAGCVRWDDLWRRWRFLLLIFMTSQLVLLGCFYAAWQRMPFPAGTRAGVAGAGPRAAPDGARVTFVTFYYPERNAGFKDWRREPSAAVARSNDRLLRAHGGLTVFTTPAGAATVRRWNVSRVVVVEGVERHCERLRERREVALCPKRVLLTDRRFLALGHVVFLDSDARLVSPAFADKIVPYAAFADFAAAPDHTGWPRLAYAALNVDYNTGVFYMRTPAFDRPEYVAHMLNACRRTIDQHCLSAYIRRQRDPPLWVELLPWKMHCRNEYIHPDCLLVHNWGKIARFGLQWALRERKEALDRPDNQNAKARKGRR